MTRGRKKGKGMNLTEDYQCKICGMKFWLKGTLSYHKCKIRLSKYEQDVGCENKSNDKYKLI